MNWGTATFRNKLTIRCAAVRRGHDVQVHIHPQWLKASIVRKNDGSSQYGEFEPSDYALGSGGGDVYQRTREVVERGKQYLLDLLSPVNPEYRCVAYRAGGYAIQPQTEAIFAALEDAGIVIDSSVAPGMVVNNRLACLDFRGTPKKGNYFVSRTGGITCEAERGLFEIPVLAGPLDRVDDRARVMLRRVLRRCRRKNPCAARGYTAGQKWGRTQVTLGWRIRQFLFQTPWRLLDINLDPGEMFDLTRSYIDRYYLKESDLYFSFSGHPKDITPANLKGMKEYHRALTRRYGSSLQAITFQAAARRLAEQGAADSFGGRR